MTVNIAYNTVKIGFIRFNVSEMNVTTKFSVNFTQIKRIIRFDKNMSVIMTVIIFENVVAI